ncbi:NAD(P)/FAD-dependent oxidoreductase [Aurantiacibacter xanthus]|uniref:NAD(P)/FAD-dependent oxidoreductase n=1 Tax=Aurantiacibacter xanthus TaxID=1784712 RepID=A0A3A1PCA3_9SPHN|nr:NAD(P)/FAD-dependent oxidoreductase [Aurantiacibacter xanthus]RIV91153.1 NAD(P)/FAD-dependent oxidoreductase [Aurantiacibacter xanthus]
MEHYDVIILGGGAAGLFCAGLAGQRGMRVCVLEKASEPGKKILISGGGRCNFTNIGAGPANYLSTNRHFAKSALARYTPRDFLDLVESYGIAWHEKTLGQLFCDGSARQIVDMLLAECAKGDVVVKCGQEVREVLRSSRAQSRDESAGSLDCARDERGEAFEVRTGDGSFTAQSLVIATGGPSIPKMGASGFAYDLARQFGLKVVEPRPALVPLTLGGDDLLFRELSGVSAPVEATCEKAAFREAALFTHRGLSGPAILQVSSYWYPGKPIAIDFLPDLPRGWLTEAKRAEPSLTFAALLRHHLPARLADALGEKLALAGDLGNLPDRKLAEAETRLARWTFHPNGSEGFAKAEVTVGGISTAELSSQSMEAKTVPGLYAIGEAVDVTGWLGGYNFQWAWASAHAAALNLPRSS